MSGSPTPPGTWPTTTASSAERLAVVGSTSFASADALAHARVLIVAEIGFWQPEVVISGGAAGIDTLAREVAGELGYSIDDGSFLEFLPAQRRWAPNGFKARNEQIVAACTRLLAIRDRTSQTYGSGWTADLAGGLGRSVVRILL